MASRVTTGSAIESLNQVSELPMSRGRRAAAIPQDGLKHQQAIVRNANQVRKRVNDILVDIWSVDRDHSADMGEIGGRLPKRLTWDWL